MAATTAAAKEAGKHSQVGEPIEMGERSATVNTSKPWDESLVNSAIPATALAAKVYQDSAEETGGNNVDKEKRSLLSTFQRRTFSRISFRGEAGPLLSRYRQSRFSSRRVRKRVVFKHGDCNVVQGNVAKRRRRYLQDIFTTLVDAQWRWTLLVFSLNFVLSWLGFALVWWLIAYNHGDLDSRNYNQPNVTFRPCVEDIHGLTSCFLFSVETQHTIGYGSKHTTEECPEAIFVMCIQSMTGVILQAFMVGIVFAKLSRPKKRTQTLLFSRNAVICQRDGQPCLMFRVGDMRKSHIIEAHVRAQMIKRKVTKEGELLPFFQTELKVGGDGEEDKIFFIWPTTIVHKIDEHSPLYHISASDMLRERFEIVVILEGVIESTGMTTQARSSYLSSEILWGHRFEHIITFRKETGEYEVNYTLFDNTYEVDTPLCSAADLRHREVMRRAKGEGASSADFPDYQDSNGSLTSSSGSSLASSVGGLQMNLPSSTPPTPIPVMITGPDGNLRRESINTPQATIPKPTTFQSYDESAEDESDETVAARNIQELRNEEDYNRVLEEVNASLRRNRKPSLRRKEERKRQNTLERRKNELPTADKDGKAVWRGIVDEGQGYPHLPKKSPSKATLDSRHTRFADSPDVANDSGRNRSHSRRSSLCDGQTSKNSFFAEENEKRPRNNESHDPRGISPDTTIAFKAYHESSMKNSRPQEEV